MKSCAGKTVVKEEPTAEPEPDKPVEKSSSLLPVVLLIVIAGVGAAVYFLKFRKNTPKTSGTADLDDYDYGEDEDENEYEDENEEDVNE